MDSQTVVLGGLITKSKQDNHRKVPYLGDVPYLGRLFRYDSVSNQRTELLIILTPHVVRNESDAESIKKIEAERMNWCLCDVIRMTGDNSLRQRNSEWSDKETPVIYPDLDPRAAKALPPEGAPGAKETIPTPPAEPGRTPPVSPLPPTLNQGPNAMPSEPMPMQPTSGAMPPDARLKTPQNAASAGVNNPSGVVPTAYDAPPRYPTTQTPYYR
jgi:hypothetical protein